MPYKCEKILLPPELDRRRKLSDDDKEVIRHKYKTGFYSQRALAREYKVSRRLVSFILFPEKYEEAKAQNKDRRKDGRYKPSDKEWAATQREHRHYKQALYKAGKLTENKEEE